MSDDVRTIERDDEENTHVRRYAAGLVDWGDAGLPLEGAWLGRQT